MKKLTSLALLALFLATGGVYANEKLIKEIEKRQEDCVEKDGSTSGQIDCAEAAYKEWDRALNKAYKKLLAAYPSKIEKDALRSSQRAWLKFRNLEFENIDNVYDRKEGTMYLPMRVESKTRVVRERALQLMRLASILTEL